tara:strand:+ start:85 stop:618 length:534 start_codon:yes stop_codon:yes gene_type:complete
MPNIKKEENQTFIERVWEGALWNSRYIVILGVLFSTLAGISLFILGSYEIISAIVVKNPITTEFTDHKEMLLDIITAVDLYLIGVVLLIFGFGLYELFISKIDVARLDKAVTILEIENLDELKNKIIKVIIMVLIVSFFEKVLGKSMGYNTPLEMLYFAISIFALSFGVYLVNKGHN